MITPAAAAQLALWRSVSASLSSPAVNFFDDPDNLNLLILRNVGWYNLKQDEVLGFLSLFSSCKRLRAHVQCLIAAIKMWTVPRHVVQQDVFSPFCWALTERFSVGDFLVLLRNHCERGPRRLLQFRDADPPLLNTVSRIPVVDLSLPIHGIVLTHAANWRVPFSPVVIAVAEMFSRYQEYGDISEFHKFGFFSSVVNTECFSQVLGFIERDDARDIWVTAPHRLTLLRLLILNSYSVLDLSAPLAPMGPNDTFTYLPQISGVHIGANPSDIASCNNYSIGRGPGISFYLANALLR